MSDFGRGLCVRWGIGVENIWDEGRLICHEVTRIEHTEHSYA